MTTSTENKKTKGPLRIEAIVPTAIVLGLLFLYFLLFFDSHLRRGIEFAGTQIHGAEVNIGKVKTSLWQASFELFDLQVTDKTQPERNIVQVGSMKFQLLWDALLRAKFVVEESSILDIRAHTQRSKPGYVLPPATSEGGLLAKAQEKVLEQTKKQFQQNILGDIANVLDGVDPKEQLKNIQADLKSTLRAQELESELTKKKEEWQKRIQELPKPAEIKAIEAKIKALDLKTKNPLELAKNLKQAKEILGEAEAKVKQVDSAQKDLNSDLTNYTNAIGDLEKMAAQDVADLQKRLQIPSLDAKAFSAQLFMGQLEEKLVSLRKYIVIVRKVMPPKRSAEEKIARKEEQLVPRARGKGENISFPITTGYPLFWLKKAAVSSQIEQSEWAGKVQGEIRNFSTAPSLLQDPMQVELQGDFPKQKILGLNILGEIDHRTEKAKESIKIQLASAPVMRQVFSESPQVTLGIEEAVASGTFLAELNDENLRVEVSSKFDQAKYLLEAKNNRVKDLLATVLAGIPTVTMNAKVIGSWDKFDLDLDSNLGRELSAGFQKQLQAKVGEAKAKLDSFVKEKLDPARKKVQDQLGSLSGGLGKSLAQNKSDLDSALKGAQSSAQGSGGGGGLEEKGKSLLKGFGF
jgi:uncharacterized protein (TIGR03545 family)